MKILGICAYYHDSGAALLINGEIVATAQETSFTSITDIKGITGLPIHAISYCLQKTGIQLKDLDSIAFYEKPLVSSKIFGKNEFVNSYLVEDLDYSQTMSSSLYKEFLKAQIKKELTLLGNCKRFEVPPIEFIEHDQSQATSAFFRTSYRRAAVICLNSVGEWATASVWLGRDNQLIPQWKIDIPYSLKIFYSAFTHYTGFQINFDEYKFRELAQKGKPKYVNLFLDKLLQFTEDDNFQIKTDYLNHKTQFMMTKKSHQLLEVSPQLESKNRQWEMDIAASIQKVVEEIILRLVNTVYQRLGEDYLCLAGDIAYYHLLNSRIMSETSFQDISIQATTEFSKSAALAIWHQRSANACLVNN
ncbi:MAG: hypothetical protein IGS39_24740 [Calothrix sp. C42_A2020_038]|nr:hypothetical protein [Calothrix sp. C42_A2020_038]